MATYLSTIQKRIEEIGTLYLQIEKLVLQAESETLFPLRTGPEHLRHSTHDLLEAMLNEGENESLRLLDEAEGHLYSAAIYAWQEVAGRELAATKYILERTEVKNYATALEKYELASSKHFAGRKVPRKQYKEVVSFFRECVTLSREARKVAGPVTWREKGLFWIAIGGFAVAAITLLLKLIGIF